MKYPVKMNGKKFLIDESKIISAIKNKLKKSRPIIQLFKNFEVGLDKIDTLNIEIVDLDKKYAETNADRMLLNKFMFEEGNFFDDYLFVPMHEIVHFLSRTKEENSYFADPEEQLGFVSAVAFEIDRGTDLNTIWNRIYPKIEFHFHDPKDARQFFDSIIEKAHKLL